MALARDMCDVGDYCWIFHLDLGNFCKQERVPASLCQWLVRRILVSDYLKVLQKRGSKSAKLENKLRTISASE